MRGRQEPPKAANGNPVDAIIQGDCFEVLSNLEDESVDLAFTSSPYADVKDYGQGVEVLHPDNFVDWIIPLFNQLHRVFKPHASFILNIGGRVVNKRRHPYVHELVTRACRETALEFYDEYIWVKPCTMPNGSGKRLNTVTEYLFHFCKDADRIKFNMDSVREEYAPQSISRFDYPVSNFNGEVDASGVRQKRGSKKVRINPKGKRPSNVFRFSTVCGQKDHKHPAAFHPSMPAWFIKALTDEGDLVLDPFVGSGTTCLAAQQLERRYVGIELNPEYCAAAAQRLQGGLK